MDIQYIINLDLGTHAERGVGAQGAVGEASGVVVVYHATIVAIGHGLLEEISPLVIGCVLRTVGISII